MHGTWSIRNIWSTKAQATRKMNSAKEIPVRLKPLGMLPRATMTVNKALVLKNYLESKKLAYLSHEELSTEDVAITTVVILKDSGRLSKLFEAMTAMAIEIDPSIDMAHLDTVSTDVSHPEGIVTAISITSKMETTRLLIHLIGRRIFSQYTKVMKSKIIGRSGSPNASQSIDANMRSCFVELSFLANALSNHVSCDDGNEAMETALALVSVKKTREAVDCLEMMSATYLYVLTHVLSLLTIHHAFLIPATPAILKVTGNFFNAALVDEDQLLRDDDLLSALQDRVSVYILEQIPLTAHLDNAVRWSTVTVGAAGVVTAFLASHSGMVTEDFDVLGAVDGWIGSMGDLLARLWARARGVDQEDVEAFGDAVVLKMYTFVRKNLGIPFDKSGKVDVGSHVEMIRKAIREGMFEAMCQLGG